MSKEENEEKARRRAQVIWDVRSGKITAKEGADSLGISRQCYYEWEHRALQGMVDALTDKTAGRPSNPPPDQEKEEMKRKLAQLERESLNLRQTLTVKEALLPFMEEHCKQQQSKKKER